LSRYYAAATTLTDMPTLGALLGRRTDQKEPSPRSSGVPTAGA